MKQQINNPVAKFANQYNKAKVFKDKKKDYNRKSKHSVQY
jgi:hypothetical protein